MLKSIYLFLIITILLLCISNFSSKPIDKKLIEVLKKDQFTMDNFKARYRYLSCKLIIYSKLKYMFESEKIDTFAEVTENKKEFIDIYYNEMLKRCNKLNVDNEVRRNFFYLFCLKFY